MRRWLTVLAATAAASFGLAAAPAGAAACSSVEDALTSNKASVVVTCVPAGATQINAAESTAGSGGSTKYGKIIKAEVGTTFTPSTAGYTWAGMIGHTSSAQVGGWAPRLQTVPGGTTKETKRQELEKKLAAAEASASKLGKEQVAVEKELAEISSELGSTNALVQKIKGELNELPPEESQAEREAREAQEREASEKAQHEKEAKERAEREAREQREREEREKLEEPPVEEVPGNTTFKRGVDGGRWSPASNEIKDYKLVGGSNASVRLENPGDTSVYTNAGIFVVYLLNNPKSGGIKSVDRATYVKEAEEEAARNPRDALEVENEPSGSWFWGTGANSEANAKAYVELLKAVSERVNVPIYGAADNSEWLKWMLKADPNVVHYVTAFTKHPYDGSGANPNSTLVRWPSVEEVHSLTGKPVAITEYGRPLVESTGDSPKSTEAQQAAADAAMVRKAREVGWVLNVEIYGYRGNHAPCYAVFKENDEPRPAVAAIAGA